MFYEEKFESGLWYYRNRPNVLWHAMTVEMVGQKLNEAKAENSRLREKLIKVQEILEESAESKAIKFLADF